MWIAKRGHRKLIPKSIPWIFESDDDDDDQNSETLMSLDDDQGGDDSDENEKEVADGDVGGLPPFDAQPSRGGQGRGTPHSNSILSLIVF